MNLKEIKEVIQLMNENGLSEIEMEKDGLKIRLKKGPTGAVEPVVVQETRPIAIAAKTSEASVKETVASSVKSTEVKSPMVGTFYSSPAPDAPVFVQIGHSVEVGQVICIIEAMKLMNEIKSEIRGKILEVLVHNGDPVEFGQPLFLVE